MRNVGSLGGWAAVIAVTLSMPAHALGASGQLDRGFGGDGRATAYFKGWVVGDQIADLAVAPHGKTIVASDMFEHGGHYGEDPGIARFNRDGSPDRSFSHNGQEILATHGDDIEVNVAAQANGKILLTTDGVGRRLMYRLDPNGSLDKSFGDHGAMLLPLSHIADLQLMPDGRILITGSQWNPEPDPGDYDFEALVLRRSGRPDLGFGAHGITTVDFSDPATPAPKSSDWAVSSTVTPDGRIVLVGSGNTKNPYDEQKVVVARLLANGQLDPSFCASGRCSVPGSSDTTLGVAGTSDGGLVFGGANGNDFLATRMTASGGLNTQFGDAGVSTVHVGKGTDDADALAVDRRGSIYLAGSIGGRTRRDFAVMKLTAGGEPDRLFGGGDGLATVDFEGKFDDADGIALLPNGRIVVSGTIGDWRIGLIRLLP